MLEIKLKSWSWRVWLSFLAATFASYPVSVQAATLVNASDLTAPFLTSWLGVWVFSGAGGLGASFIVIDDVDAKLRHPIIAKFVIGLFWGVGICLIVDALTSTPQGALTFFALFVSSFITPITAGLMVYVSNQKRQNKIYDQVLKVKAGIDLSESEEGDK